MEGAITVSLGAPTPGRGSGAGNVEVPMLRGAHGCRVVRGTDYLGIRLSEGHPRHFT